MLAPLILSMPERSRPPPPPHPPLSSLVAGEPLLLCQKTPSNWIYTFLLCHCCCHSGFKPTVSAERASQPSGLPPHVPPVSLTTRGPRLLCSHWTRSRTTVHEVGHIDSTRGCERELVFAVNGSRVSKELRRAHTHVHAAITCARQKQARCLQTD